MSRIEYDHRNSEGQQQYTAEPPVRDSFVVHHQLIMRVIILLIRRGLRTVLPGSPIFSSNESAKVGWPEGSNRRFHIGPIPETEVHKACSDRHVGNQQVNSVCGRKVRKALNSKSDRVNTIV